VIARFQIVRSSARSRPRSSTCEAVCPWPTSHLASAGGGWASIKNCIKHPARRDDHSASGRITAPPRWRRARGRDSPPESFHDWPRRRASSRLGPWPQFIRNRDVNSRVSLTSQSPLTPSSLPRSEAFMERRPVQGPSMRRRVHRKCAGGCATFTRGTESGRVGPAQRVTAHCALLFRDSTKT
jgi:hypothetical protein